VGADPGGPRRAAGEVCVPTLCRCMRGWVHWLYNVRCRRDSASCTKDLLCPAKQAKHLVNISTALTGAFLTRVSHASCRYIAAMRRAKFSATSVTYVASALLTYEGGPAELQQVRPPPSCRIASGRRGLVDALPLLHT